MSIIEIAGLVLLGEGALGVLVSDIVGILKHFGVVKDGDSKKWVQGMNLLSVAVIAALLIFGIQPDMKTIELVAAAASAILGAWTVQPTASNVAYMHNRGSVKVLGTSFTKAKKK